jgi:hypothetical protein
MATRQEQHTAIESAALAATRDLGKIFIEDAHFGYIGLVDYAPVGKGVAAADGYGLPVHSINSVLATIRLDMLIAQKLNNPDMLQMAATDYQYAMSAKDQLNATLASAVLPTAPNFTDVEGKSFNVYQDALNAYQQNVVRMAGPSQLSKNSLSLTLGLNQQSSTTTVVPSPSDLADLRASDQINGCYVAYKNIPFKKYNFVFCGTAANTALFDLSTFTATDASTLPYCVPSSVLAQAAQTFTKGAFQSSDKACAQVGGPQDTRPDPGALVVSFPDGCPTEITTIQSMIDAPAISAIPMTWYGTSGDFPAPKTSVTKLANLNYPLDSLNSAKSAIELGLYCWLKHAGPGVNIQSVSNMVTAIIVPGGIIPRVEEYSGATWPQTAYAPNGPFIGSDTCQLGLMSVYTLNAATGIIQQQTLVEDWIYVTNSDAQVVAVSNQSLSALSTVRTYDTVVAINDYQFGATAGGAHGGEPILDNRFTQNPVYTPNYVPTPLVVPPVNTWPTTGPSWAGDAGGWAYQNWKQVVGGSAGGGDVTWPYLTLQPKSSAGEIRPTYQQNGLSVEIALHKVTNTHRCFWGSTGSYLVTWTNIKYH